MYAVAKNLALLSGRDGCPRESGRSKPWLSSSSECSLSQGGEREGPFYQSARSPQPPPQLRVGSLVSTFLSQVPALGTFGLLILFWSSLLVILALASCTKVFRYVEPYIH